MKFPGKFVDNMIEVAYELFVPYRIIQYDREVSGSVKNRKKEKLIPWKI